MFFLLRGRLFITFYVLVFAAAWMRLDREGAGAIDPSAARRIKGLLLFGWLTVVATYAGFVDRRGPSRFCRALFQIERTALHSCGPGLHSCAVLCNFLTGSESTAARASPWCSPPVKLSRSTSTHLDQISAPL